MPIVFNYLGYGSWSVENFDIPVGFWSLRVLTFVWGVGGVNVNNSSVDKVHVPNAYLLGYGIILLLG